MRLLRLFTNKFLIATVAFAVWMVFFDQNDLASIQERREHLQDTKDHIAALQEDIRKMEAEYQAIKTDPRTLETFAREEFRMKRDGEDLYVIEEEQTAE